MLMTIHDGSQKDINVGNSVIVVTGFLPPQFDNKMIPIVEIQDGLPYAQLEPSQLSVIDPSLIKVVI